MGAGGSLSTAAVDTYGGLTAAVVAGEVVAEIHHSNIDLPVIVVPSSNSGGPSSSNSSGGRPSLIAEDPPSSSDDDDVDNVVANLSVWFTRAGLLARVADAAAKEALRRGLHNPRRLLDEWSADKGLFDSFGCLNRHDIKDILLTPLFLSTAASGRHDPFERLGDHFSCIEDEFDMDGEGMGIENDDNLRRIMAADSTFLQDMMRQQLALDTAARELRNRQALQDDRARRIIEETQGEMMEMLDYAMQLSLQHTSSDTDSYVYDDMSAAGIFAPPMASLIGNPSIDGRGGSSSRSAPATKKTVLVRFDPQMSSPLLEYSPSLNSAFRRGSIGAQPAALVLAPGPRCCLSLRLEAAPIGATYLSIGIAEWSPDSGMVTGLLNGTYRCFGKTRLSWGLYDRRDTDGAEVWSDSRRVGACRSLCEGDVVSLSTDISHGLADLYLNNSIIYTFDSLHFRAGYVLGATVADDHKLLVVSRDLPSPRPPIDDSDSLGAGGGVLAGILAGMADESYSDEGCRDTSSPDDLIRSMVDITSRAIVSPTAISAAAAVHPPTPATVALPAISQRARAVPLPAAAPAAAAADTLREGGECVICLCAPKAVVLLPCRHMCLCEACGLSARRGIELCPVCREPVKDRFKVFV